MSASWEAGVKCEYCELTFGSQEALKQHLRLHSRRKPYRCDDCGARFSYNSTLEWHRRSHVGELPHKCSECGAQFAESSILVWHRRKHKVAEAAIVVTVADTHVTGLYGLPGLVTSPVTHGDATVTVVTCDATNVVTNTPTSDFSSSVVVAGVEAVLDAPSKRKSESEGTFHCDVCGMAFGEDSGLRAHMDTRHNVGHTNPFHLLARQHPAKKHRPEKPHKCDLCFAGFNTEGHLRTHREKHTAERPFRCDKCSLAFSDRASLEAHERRHQAERPFRCGQCGASFYRATHLDRHHKRHTGELV